MVSDSDLLSLISIAQTSVLAWLAIGLGTFIGLIATKDDTQKNKKPLDLRKEVMIQISILIFISSLGMIIVHMGDIYNYRDKLNSTYLPRSTQWWLFQGIDCILKYIYENPLSILIICICAWIIIECLLDTNLEKVIFRKIRREQISVTEHLKENTAKE